MTDPIVIWCQEATRTGQVTAPYRFGRPTDEDRAAYAVRTWCTAWAAAGYDVRQDARYGCGWFAVDASGPQIRVRATLWIEYPEDTLRCWLPGWLDDRWVKHSGAPAWPDTRDVAERRTR